MNTNQITRSNKRGSIRGLTDLPVPARYAKAARSFTAEDTVSDVYYTAKKLHLNASKLCRRVLEVLPDEA
jgi:hypothetical protein